MKKKNEKYIYCWKCGVKNDKKNKKCVACDAKLNEEEHPLFTWLFGEIKEEAEDGIFDYFCELLKSFFRKHLYGVIVGLAVTFAAVSSVVNIMEPENAEITTEEYSIPKVVETVPKEEPKQEEEVSKEETPVEPQPETPKPAATPKPTTPQPTPTPEPQPSTPEPEEKPKELYCPTGFTLTNENKCVITEYLDAWIKYTCPEGYEYTSNGDDKYCLSTTREPMETEYFCAANMEEYKKYYGDSLCASMSDVVTSTLDSVNHKCSYSFFYADGSSASCILGTPPDALTRRSCPAGTMNNGDYCYKKTDYAIKYYCLNEQEELVGNKCKTTTILEPLER